ncbi:Transthyretin/hydroxyisourate hydrolase [Macleaya cordata]|uniref:Transthyretin/hydroxyisourate hydrolase n=1 Tax=Macleaya cordata TaxID=56857 RepID=A0A200PSV2_MACCD|nr:Transthyretin/hydroxyisourate hydrolase [Macleaya cordata]
MVSAAPFPNFELAVEAARNIWFNKVDVNGWLEAFGAHPQIGNTSAKNQKTETSAQWSKGEQSTALATATDSTLQELLDWNARYREKFGFVCLICATAKSTPQILSELKNRFPNRPIVEFEIAAREQMKITELRLAKLYAAKAEVTPASNSQNPVNLTTKAGEDRVSIIGGHLAVASASKASQTPGRTRPPITTHVLDVSRGTPAADIEVNLEIWKGVKPRPLFGELNSGGWVLQGSSITDTDGRSGHLMSIVDNVEPGIYRISFNTGKYVPTGFFPYASIVFEIKESQKSEHFHVPLLLSPFSFTTYRGS